MRIDSKGNPDVCRETPTIPRGDALDTIRKVKLATNALLAILSSEASRRQPPEVMRLLSSAYSAYEEGALWATKALSSEDWKAPTEEVNE